MSAASVDGVALVLLSGTLGTERLWDDVRTHLATDRPCLARRSDAAESVEATAGALLEQVPERVAVVGHSFGGIVATELLRQAPERVERLALVSASARPASADQRRTWATWRDRVRAGELRGLAEEVTTASLGSDVDAEAHDRAVAMAVEAGADGLLRQLTAQERRPDGHAVLARAGVPLLAVAGEADRVCPPELSAAAVRDNARAVLVRLRGVGHLSPLEAPADVARALDTWLARPIPTLGPTRTPHVEGDQ